MKNLFAILFVFLLPFIPSCKVDVKSQVRCGDGTVNLNEGEQCDTDNLNSASCLSLGYHGGQLACTSACTFDIAACLETGRCGDGDLNRPMEDCDGDDLDGQTCMTLGYHGGELACAAGCVFDTAACEAAGRCGDGLIQSGAGETCDGDDLDGLTCEALGFYGGQLACGDACTFDTTACEQGIYCGDGLIQEAWGETCDGDDLDGLTCEALGFYGGQLACGDDCTLDAAACEAAGRCGDGLIQEAWGETCDASNLGGQTCQTLGFATGSLFCGADCAFDTGACFNWTSIATGGVHTCAIGPDATVWCWGANDYGQLGDGTNLDSLVPVQVTGLTGVRQIAAGYFHTCAVLEDDSVVCWGSNGTNQLGDLSSQNRSTPVAVFGPLLAVSVAAGTSHTCALRSDGTVRCWGDNFAGQLGDGSTTLRDRPTPVLGINSAIALSANTYNTCVLLSDGTVSCWGANDYGQLGIGTFGGMATTPGAVSGLSTARSVSVGHNHVCTVLSDATVVCWGRNGAGQCGDGTFENHSTFVPVYNVTTATAVSSGNSFACALLGNGSLRCWGNNPSGQLGDGSLDSSAFPVAVSGLTGATAVSCGANHTCAATSAASLYCWGANARGQLGDGSTNDSTVPIEVQ
ncbi:MAG: hypothetical protein CVU59_00365 [Deltaproteobacteria bacterium HGW-Deltaproteobacteria-17]|nr:MAG: hypothetical protein CVU59_00365 [Deltaproteobacteria bacterium HGW-Deltaproteobacteria-17]